MSLSTISRSSSLKTTTIKNLAALRPKVPEQVQLQYTSAFIQWHILERGFHSQKNIFRTYSLY